MIFGEASNPSLLVRMERLPSSADDTFIKTSRVPGAGDLFDCAGEPLWIDLQAMETEDLVDPFARVRGQVLVCEPNGVDFTLPRRPLPASKEIQVPGRARVHYEI